MKIFTSYYAAYDGPSGVQISNSTPEGYIVNRKIPQLYPDWRKVQLWNTVKHLPRGTPERQVIWSIFCQDYRARLQRLGSRQILELLNDGDVLLGWFPENCHRAILARYLTEHGVEVEEIRQWSSVQVS